MRHGAVVAEVLAAWVHRQLMYITQYAAQGRAVLYLQ